MLDRWLSVRPRITVLAALILSLADGLAHLRASLWMVALLIACICTTLIPIRRWRLACVLSLLCAGMYIYSIWRQPGSFSMSEGTAVAQRRWQGRISGIVVETSLSPQAGTPHARASIKLRITNWQAASTESACPVAEGDVVLMRMPLWWGLAPAKNARLTFDCQVRAPAHAQFPWDYDETRHLEHQGVRWVVTAVARPKVEDVAAAPDAVRCDVFDELRQRMVDAHRQAIGIQLGDLLSSMVIGDRAVAPDERTSDEFRALGLTHLIAASGFNLTIVSAVAWWTIRFFTRSNIAIGVWSFSWIVAFSLIAGMSPSVERAALMCTMLLVCTSLRRSAYLPASVAVAEIVTLVLDPSALFDVGFQLSYSVTFAIACGVNRVNVLLNTLLRMPRMLSEALGVVWIASATSVPLQIFYFWQVGELSLLANLVVGPLVPVITVVGFVSSFIATFNIPACLWLSGALDAAVRLPLMAMMWEVGVLSTNCWSVLDVGAPPAVALAIYYLALSALIMALPARAKQKPTAALATALLCYCLSCVVLFYRHPLDHPVAIECRDSVLFITPDRHALLLGNTSNLSARRASLYFGVRRLAIAPCADVRCARSAIH